MCRIESKFGAAAHGKEIIKSFERETGEQFRIGGRVADGMASAADRRTAVPSTKKIN